MALSVGTDALSTLPLMFDAAAVDDFNPPTSCTSIDGADIVVELTSSATVTYLVSVTGASLTARFALSELASCDAPTASACAATTRSRPAALVVDIDADASRVLRIEGVGGSLQAQLQVRPVESVVQAGSACVIDDFDNPCVPGFECTENTGLSICTAVPEVPGTVGEPGAPGEAEGECVAGTYCDDTSSTCTVSPEATCEGRALFGDLVEEADGGDVVVELVPSLGFIRGSCESYPAVVLINLDEPRSTWVRVTAESVDGSPVALSVRSRCSLDDSESACLREPDGDATAVAWIEPGDDGGTLIVTGFSSVVLTAARVTTRGAGEACDAAGLENRCELGLTCQGGQCRAPLAGTCGDPVPGFVAAEGDLVGRGLTFEYDTCGLTAVARPGCDGTYRTQVFEFTAPSAGAVTARTTTSSTPVLLQLVTDCGSTPSLAGCDSLPTAERSVALGERFFVVVSSSADSTGVITLQLQAQSEVGGPCSETLSCRGALRCSAGVCRLPVVAAGEACVPGEVECVTGFACLPDDEGFSCLPRVVGERSPCEVFTGLPTCSPGFECLVDGGVRLCADPDVVTGRCDSSDECAVGFACVDNRCAPITGGETGDPCDVMTPGACAEGFACVVPAGGSIDDATCQAVSAGCGPSNRCMSPQVCVETVCYTSLSQGAPCTEGSGAPCGASLACQGGTCQPDRGGIGTACATSTECQEGLFCASVPPFDPTCSPRRAAGEVCVPGGDPLECATGLVCAANEFALFVCQAAP